MSADRWFFALVGGYIGMAVLCFGPATVQSERARDAHRAQCQRDHAEDASQLATCQAFGPSVSDGLPKAMFWPLWLSYRVTVYFSEQGAQ